MTTLLSKGLELEQSLKKSFESAQSQLKRELESRGLRLSAEDLAALVEDLAPSVSRTTLNSALEFLRPYTAGLGLRVSHLSDTQVEVVIPTRTRNCHENGALHESVLLAAGTEACRLLLTRHAPLGGFEIQTKEIQLQMLKTCHEQARVRWELPETNRESLMAELRESRQAELEADVRILCESEQSAANLKLRLTLKHVPALDTSDASSRD